FFKPFQKAKYGFPCIIHDRYLFGLYSAYGFHVFEVKNKSIPISIYGLGRTAILIRKITGKISAKMYCKISCFHHQHLLSLSYQISCQPWNEIFPRCKGKAARSALHTLPWQK